MLNKTMFVNLLLKDGEHADNLQRIFSADPDWCILSKKAANQPDLIIYEIDPGKEKDLQEVEDIIGTNETAEVFITAGSIDTSTLMRLMRIGAKEFIMQPVNPEDVSRALNLFKERRTLSRKNSSEEFGQIISILGGKGGVGTTTVAVNLAISLKTVEENRKIVLLDMNTLFGEIPLFLEVAPKFHWGEITKNIDRLDDTFLLNVLTDHASGIHLLPSPAHLNGHLPPTPETIERILRLMKSMFDYVIIDLGQSTNETALKVLQISDSVMLVSIPSLPCLANTNRLMKSVVDLGYVSENRIKIILNRYMKKNEISLEDVRASINNELFWVIPNDYRATMAAINNGKPLQEIAPNSDISKNLIELAEKFLHRKGAEKKKRRTLTSFFRNAAGLAAE
ncbi:MAG: AAA family ATPase [Desulfobacterales bacterium]